MKNGDSFYSKTKKVLDEFNAELSKENLLTTTYENYSDFYKLYDNYLSKFKSLMGIIEKEILEHFTTFTVEISKKNNDNFELFEKIIDEVQNEKKVLEKLRNNYFDSSEDLKELEEKKLKKKVKEEELATAKKKAETDCEGYKNQLEKMNKLLETSETKYNELMTTVHQDEEYKLNFIEIHFSKLNQVFTDDLKAKKEFTDKMTYSIKKINIKRDISIFKNHFSYTLNKIRFPKEIFLSFDFYKKPSECSLLLSDTANLAQIESVSKDKSQKDHFICNIDISNIHKEEEDNETQFFEIDEKLSPIVEKIMTSKTSISNDELGSIIYQIDKNKKGSENFLGCVFSYYKKHVFVNIQCLDNLHHLANIIVMIVANTLNNVNAFNLNFAIMYIAEKTVYINPDNIFNKCYLCNLLSKNKVFKNRDYWTRLMRIRIAMVIDGEVKQEIEKMDSMNRIDSNVLSKMKSIFGSKHKKIENDILFNQLSDQKKADVAVKIIEDYIQHFSNFSLEISDSIDIIINLQVEFNFDREYVNFFNAMLNSNFNTVKSKTALIEDIEHKVDYKALYFNENFCDDRSLVNTYEKLCCYSLKYLQIKDFINVLCISKKFNAKLKKIIYRNVLLKYHDMPIKDRLDIWKTILNYHSAKRNKNYKELLEEMKAKPEIVPSRDIIELDVARTPFVSNAKENRAKISNILRAIANQCPHINYSQGMNYIAAFLLTLIGDEEDSFYIYYSLLMSTDYGGLFPNDLEKLKKIFYVFDRLLNILMPEIYFYLKNNSITVSYFISPWFITLFTNAFQYIKEKDKPKVLLRIWDLFLFDGWKSIIKIGISLIKHFETKLLSLSSEDLLQFLINDIIKSDFFSNENFDTLMFISVNMNIEENLMLNIENEYEIKRKIQKQPFTLDFNKK